MTAVKLYEVLYDKWWQVVYYCRFQTAACREQQIADEKNNKSEIFAEIRFSRSCFWINTCDVFVFIVYKNSFYFHIKLKQLVDIIKIKKITAGPRISQINGHNILDTNMIMWICGEIFILINNFMILKRTFFC